MRMMRRTPTRRNQRSVQLTPRQWRELQARARELKKQTGTYHSVSSVLRDALDANGFPK